MRLPVKRLPSGVGGGAWVYFFADGSSISEMDLKHNDRDTFENHFNQLDGRRLPNLPNQPTCKYCGGYVWERGQVHAGGCGDVG